MDAQALGRYLRETRETKELTLDEAEQDLRIRRRILESFEIGEFILSDFAPIQIRGFIRNYARYLGLEEDRIVGYYEAALTESANPKKLSGRQGRRGKKDKRDSKPDIPIAPRKVTDTPPSLPPVVIPPPQQASSTFAPAAEARRGGGLVATLLRLLVALTAVAVIAYVIVEVMQTQDLADPFAPEGGDILANLPPSPSFTPFATPAEVSILPTALPNLQPGFTGQGVLVTISVEERTWLRIAADGVEQYVGIATPGTALEYPAGDNVSVTASNAQGLNVVYNGQQQPVFGGRGQRVDIVFSTRGVDISTGPGFDPTAINSPTPIPTPTDAAGALVEQLTPSPTIAPTDTPGPSPTPSDTPTETPIPTDTPVPTDTPIPSDTPTLTLTPSLTPTLTITPSPTLTPSVTPIPSDTPIPTATSILPPRELPPDATPTKIGGR